MTVSGNVTCQQPLVTTVSWQLLSARIMLWYKFCTLNFSVKDPKFMPHFCLYLFFEIRFSFALITVRYHYEESIFVHNFSVLADYKCGQYCMVTLLVRKYKNHFKLDSKLHGDKPSFYSCTVSFRISAKIANIQKLRTFIL